MYRCEIKGDYIYVTEYMSQSIAMYRCEIKGDYI